MKPLEKLARFWEDNRRVLIIAVASVLSVLFAGSIILAVFVGGEFGHKKVEQTVKGKMTIIQSDYATSYLAGDKFDFDMETAEIQLIAKDPDTSEIVRKDKLESTEYGFRVNGQGNIFNSADAIEMREDMEFISVVSTDYPDIKVDIPVRVISLEKIDFKTELLYEAEDANLYKDGKLLTTEEKATQPSLDKPFLSNAGETVMEGSAIKCEGDACLRSLGELNVNVDFEIVCTEETTVNLEIMICKRPQAKNFGDSFALYLNGTAVTEADKISVPARDNGETDYFTSHTMSAISIRLERGVNVISFVNKKNNPGNLDAIKLTAGSAVIGVFAN